MFLHRHWPAALLVSGGVLDQPAIYVASMRLLDHACDTMRRTIDEDDLKKTNGH
ncbi:MAG: hypothetical protein V2A73_21345 [Pseudomonadota bacterium]